MKRIQPSSLKSRDFDAKAAQALETARSMPAGQGKTEALKKVGILRNAADLYGLGLTKSGRPSK